MNERLLRKLIKQIESGRALWAIFWANEYLSPEHPVRHALIHKAGLNNSDSLSELEEKATSGLRLSDLSGRERQLIKIACLDGVSREMSSISLSTNISPIHRRPEGRRAMLRRSTVRLQQPARASRESRRVAW